MTTTRTLREIVIELREISLEFDALEEDALQLEKAEQLNTRAIVVNRSGLYGESDIENAPFDKDEEIRIDKAMRAVNAKLSALVGVPDTSMSSEEIRNFRIQRLGPLTSLKV